MKHSAPLLTLAALALSASSAFGQCPEPASYCSTSPNSVGSGALISWFGTPSPEADDFHLLMTDAPSNQFMVFYYGAGQVSLPFGDGLRCVGAGGVGTFRFPVQQIDSIGSVSMKVDFSQPPAGGDPQSAGAWRAGDTWHCQGWYRDPAAGGSGFNLSDALQVQVCAGDASVLFRESFDASASLPSGWTTGANAPADSGSTAWEIGTPSSVGPSAAFSPANCAGTNIDAVYGSATDIWLRTPPIDLAGVTSATLSFKEFKDIEAIGTDQDFGTLSVLSAADLSVLAVIEAQVEASGATSWDSYAVTLPEAAYGQEVLIEFRLRTDAADSTGIFNGGFELPVLSNGSWNTTGGPGWTSINSSGGIWNPDSGSGFPGGAAYEGQNIGWTGGASGTSGGGGLSQVLSGAVLEANKQYVVSAQVGNPFFNPGTAGGAYRIELVAGDVIVHTYAGTSPTEGQWQPVSTTYSSGPSPAQLGQPLELRLIANGSDEVDFDQVSISGLSGSASFSGWYIDDVEVRRHPEGQWQILPNSPLAPYYHHDDMYFVDESTGWLCNISGEIWKTTDAGDSWTRVLNQPETSFRTIVFADHQRGWVANLGVGGWTGTVSDPNILYETTDGGLTWSAVTNFNGPTPDGICGLEWIAPDTIYGAGRYAGGAYFITSRDGGASWTSKDLNIPYDGFVDTHFFNEDEGYITGHVSAPGGVDAARLLHTTDGGQTWTTVISNDAYHYWKIGFASDTFGYGVAAYGPDGNKWIQTYDGGETWTDRVFADNFEANGIGFLNEQIGFIGGNEPDTYQTFDGGANWTSIQIDPLYGDRCNKFIKVGDDTIYGIGMRIYKFTIGGQLNLQADTSSYIPEDFDNALCSITTHPVAERVSVTYTVPEDDHVQVTIYQWGGIILDRPVDEELRAGTYTFEFTPTPGQPKELYASIVTGFYRQTARFDNPR